jgi:hypothetical protein
MDAVGERCCCCCVFSARRPAVNNGKAGRATLLATRRGEGWGGTCVKQRSSFCTSGCSATTVHSGHRAAEIRTVLLVRWDGAVSSLARMATEGSRS